MRNFLYTSTDITNFAITTFLPHPWNKRWHFLLVDICIPEMCSFKLEFIMIAKVQMILDYIWFISHQYPVRVWLNGLRLIVLCHMQTCRAVNTYLITLLYYLLEWLPLIWNILPFLTLVNIPCSVSCTHYCFL